MSELFGPRQVILVTCRSQHQKELSTDLHEHDGIITLAWHMPVSFEPALYAIAVGKKHFCHQLIEKSGVFVVNFMPFEQTKAAEICGSVSSEHVDKFKATHLTKEQAETIDCPRIKEALGFLECRVKEKIEAGDHTIFIGVIHFSHLKQEKARIYHDGDKFLTTTK